MSRAAVEIHDLTVLRGRRIILRIDDLSFPSGQVTAILGPNGAGKSTLLKCLVGFVGPTEGRLRVLDAWLSRNRLGPLWNLRRRIGYVPQILAASRETPLKGREVVAIGRTGAAGLFRPLKSSDWDMVDHWLQTLGLANLAQRAYASLSGGEQRKTLIAKAMVQQPQLLMLDEPTANLDLYWREQIVEILERLHAALGLTILLVCHELEVIPECCGRLLVLEDGRPSAFGPPDEVLTAELVERLYGPRLKLIASEGRFAAAPVGGGRRWT